MRLIGVERFKFGAIRRCYSAERGCEIDMVSYWDERGATIIRIRPRLPSRSTRKHRTILRRQRMANGMRADVVPFRRRT
jgi:hypothetical protein